MSPLRIPAVLLLLTLAGPAAAGPIADVAAPVAPPDGPGPSCITLLWENAYLLAEARTLPALLSAVESVVIVNSSCDELEFVMWLIGNLPLP